MENVHRDLDIAVCVMHHCQLDQLVASQHITDGLWMPRFQPQPNEQPTLRAGT